MVEATHRPRPAIDPQDAVAGFGAPLAQRRVFVDSAPPTERRFSLPHGGNPWQLLNAVFRVGTRVNRVHGIANRSTKV